MINDSQHWSTPEEAEAARHEYAQRFQERTEKEGDLSRFLDAHTVLKIEEGVFVIALKAGENPFTFS